MGDALGAQNRALQEQQNRSQALERELVAQRAGMNPGATPALHPALAVKQEPGQEAPSAAASSALAPAVAPVAMATAAAPAGGMDVEPSRKSLVDDEDADDALYKQLTRNLDPKMMKEVRKIMNEYGDNVRKYLSNKEHIKNLQGEITELKAGRYPAKCKKFALPFAADEWEKPYPTPGEQLVIKIPNHFTLRQARELVYKSAIQIGKTIDQLVLDELLREPAASRPGDPVPRRPVRL